MSKIRKINFTSSQGQTMSCEVDILYGVTKIVEVQCYDANDYGSIFYDVYKKIGSETDDLWLRVSNHAINFIEYF